MAVPVIKMATIGLLPSPLKKLYYKAKGAKIGKHVSFGFFSILNAKEIEIGDYTKIGHICYIDAHKIKLGKRVSIKMMVAAELAELEMDDDSIILDQVTIGGMLTPRSKLSMGKRAKIFSFSFINPTEPIILEDDVGVGGGSYIFTHSSWLSMLDGYPVTFGPVTIRKKVWLPWRVFILPNVEIGEGSVIGANSVVTANIPDHSLASGFPAKVLLRGRQFIREPSAEKKHEMLLTIFRSFAEFCEFKGEPAAISDVEKGITVSVNSTRYMYKKSLEGMTEFEGNVYVVLEGISEETRKALDVTGKCWFDIKSKETRFSESEGWEGMKGFLSRYGVRFEVLD